MKNENKIKELITVYTDEAQNFERTEIVVALKGVLRVMDELKLSNSQKSKCENQLKLAQKDSERLNWLDDYISYDSSIALFGPNLAIAGDGGTADLRSIIDKAMENERGIKG